MPALPDPMAFAAACPAADSAWRFAVLLVVCVLVAVRVQRGRR